MIKRPVDPNPLLFAFVDGPIIVKGLSPMQEQRQKDGSPMTKPAAPLAAKPVDKKLVLDSLSKSASLTPTKKESVECKPDPDEIVKAFLRS